MPRPAPWRLAQTRQPYEWRQQRQPALEEAAVRETEMVRHQQIHAEEQQPEHGREEPAGTGIILRRAAPTPGEREECKQPQERQEDQAAGYGGAGMVGNQLVVELAQFVPDA